MPKPAAPFALTFMVAMSAIPVLADLAPSTLPPAGAASGTTPSAALYEALVAKVQNGDADVDYTVLRLSYAMTDHYDPYRMATGELFAQAWKAVQEKDCKTVFEKTSALLKIEFVNIDAHAFLSDCYEQAGDKAGSDRELAIGRGLVHSLMASGDGKSPATAFQVVTLREEGFVMASFQAREEQQSLITSNGHSYDLLTGKSRKTGEPVNLYFNVDPLFASMAKTFGGKPDP